MWIYKPCGIIDGNMGVTKKRIIIKVDDIMNVVHMRKVYGAGDVELIKIDRYAELAGIQETALTIGMRENQISHIR